MAVILFLTLSLALFVFADVDFNDIPGCARNSCFPFHASSIGCSQFTTDCFCNEAWAPLTCATNSCIGQDWFGLEDWFDKICPSPPLVDFSSMPGCSRSCIRTAIIPSLCPAFVDGSDGNPKITRNCFCRTNSTFTSLTSCLSGDCMLNKTAATQRLEEEYKSTCIYNVGFGGGLGGSQSGDEIIQQPGDGSNGNGLSTVELVSIVLGIVGSLITVWVAWVSTIRWLRRQREVR